MNEEYEILLAILSKQEADHEEAMKSLTEVREEIGNSRHSWLGDFSANVAGNYFADFTIWAAGKLFRNFRI